MGPFTTENFRRAFVDVAVVLACFGFLSLSYCGWLVFVDHNRTTAMWELVNNSLQQQQRAQAPAQQQAAPPAKTE